MSSWTRIFNCCEKANYIKNNEVEMNNFDLEGKEKEDYKMDDNIKNIENSNNEAPNILYNSKAEFHSCFLNNKQIASSNNINNLNLDKTQKYINTPEDYKNYSNKVINNNIINNNIIKITNNNNFLNMNKNDFNYMSFCSQSNINKSIVNEKPKHLLLSGNLFYNKSVKITESGLENSLRNKSEFPVFFGTETTVDKNGIPYNDYIVNYSPKLKKKQIDEESKEINDNNNNNNISNSNNFSNENGMKEKEDEKGGRLFQIILDRNKNEYILNFIHNSHILYYRINTPIYFDYEKEYYFILGNVFLSITTKKTGEKHFISIRVETEDQKAEKANFENAKKLVIGRANTCDIEIDKPCISKMHSVIEYDNNLNHYFYRDNNSTNGSTLLIREDDTIAIKGSMYFKLEDISFIIKEV
jgi:hypothetical protein